MSEMEIISRHLRDLLYGERTSETALAFFRSKIRDSDDTAKDMSGLMSRALAEDYDAAERWRAKKSRRVDYDTRRDNRKR